MSVALLPAREPDPEIVSALEDLLARAMEGRIVSVAVAAALTNREVLTLRSGSEDRFALLGALRYLEARICGAIEDP